MLGIQQRRALCPPSSKMTWGGHLSVCKTGNSPELQLHFLKPEEFTLEDPAVLPLQSKLTDSFRILEAFTAKSSVPAAAGA